MTTSKSSRRRKPRAQQSPALPPLDLDKVIDETLGAAFGDSDLRMRVDVFVRDVDALLTALWSYRLLDDEQRALVNTLRTSQARLWLLCQEWTHRFTRRTLRNVTRTTRHAAHRKSKVSPGARA